MRRFPSILFGLLAAVFVAVGAAAPALALEGLSKTEGPSGKKSLSKKDKPDLPLQVIVKFKSNFTSQVEGALPLTTLTATATAAQAQSVTGSFLNKHHAKTMRPVFRDLVQ